MTAVVALSEVDISNMALSGLGISIGIQSFDDKTEQAKACKFWYPICRNQLLRSAPWNFAYTSLALASDATVFPGYTYAYQYPNDCLQAIAVTTIYGQRFRTFYWGNYWGYPYGSFGAIPKIPFKVVTSTAVAGQKAILCDLPAPAYLFYISCITDPAMFDVLFTEGLASFVGSKVGGPLKASVQKIALASQMAESARLRALAQCMNEAQQDPAPPSPSISVRW